MQISSSIALIFPIGLMVIMFGMGLTLTVDDFKRVVVYPRAVLVGSLSQILLLPVIGFCCAVYFGLNQEMAIGLVLLSACAGGATSNMLTYLSRGDGALSVSLTAISSCISIVTLPVVVTLALNYFMAEDASIQLPVLRTILSLFVVTVIPVMVGMIVNAKNSAFAAKAEPIVQKISMVVMVSILVSTFVKGHQIALDYFASIGPASCALNIIAMAVGYSLARMAGLNDRQRTTITIEVGVQNVVTAIFVATSLLQNAALSIPATMYALPMFFNAIVFVVLRRRGVNI